MNTVIFIFSLLVIIILAMSIIPLLLIYFKSKKKTYLYVSLLAICYLIESIFLQYTDFFNYSEITKLPDTFISIPFLKIALFSIMLFLYTKTIFEILDKKCTRLPYLIIVYFVALQVYFSSLPETTMTIWLFYSTRQFFMISLCLYFFIQVILCKNEALKKRFSPFISLMLVIFLLNISILIEDTFVISQQYTFSTSGVIFRERNYTENILWIVICSFTLFIGRKHLTVLFETQPVRSAVSIDLDYYKFTPREKEIVLLLLDHYENNEIATKLFITNGTLKSHIHNIYAKADVKHRNEFIRKLSQDTI